MSTKTGKSMPLRLYFMRHGETEWSISGQYTGRTDIPLTAHGEEEARALGRRLQGISFSHVLTSPLQRAQQTCTLTGVRPLSYEHDRIEAPAIALWNARALETL